MAAWSTMTDRSPPTEIRCGSEVHAMAFSVDAKHLMTSDDDGVKVWAVEDGKRVRRMATGSTHCLAVSGDARWFAAGTSSGVIVWDAETYEPVFARTAPGIVTAVDFSRDSKQLAVVLFNAFATTILDVESRLKVQTLHHNGQVIAAKYAPKGDRIATATHEVVRVWDSSDGRLLVAIPVEVTPEYNNGLSWSNDHLFVVSGDAVKQFDASTGSLLWECPVPSSIGYSCIALQRHGELMAYSTSRTIMFWHTPTRTQLAIMHHPRNLFFFALSPDAQSLAIGGRDGEITIKRLSRISAPDIQIGDAVLDSWKRGELEHVETSLTEPRNPSHHVLASRALVRARLQQWDAALADAEMAVNIRPSVIGYIAKSIALVSKGERHKGYQACDIACEHFHSSHVSFILLIKAIIVCMSGEYHEAISRMDDLITAVPLGSICYVVQAYMYFLYGDSRMRCGDYEGAVRSFECAQVRVKYHESRALSVISLIFGWRFDDLGMTVQQRLCEALCAAGRTKDAGQSLLKMLNTFEKEVYVSGPITKWVAGITQQCLSTPGVDDDAVSSAGQGVKASAHRATPRPLLREWAKAALASGSWKDAMTAATNFTVPRSATYRVIYERLGTLDRVTDAAECFRQIEVELLGRAGVDDEQVEWILGKLEALGDAAMTAERYGEAIARYSAALALDLVTPYNFLIKRSRAYMVEGSWERALHDANKAIKLEPSSPWGYERKCAALLKAGDYGNVIPTFKAMLSKISQSPDLDILGDQVLGQLLAQLLTTSGDTSILAWTGKSGCFNSCFPVDIAVFNAALTPHVPLAIMDDKMERITTGMRALSLDLTLLVKLYDRLYQLPMPSFLGRRMVLPCLVFKVGTVLATRNTSGRVFQAETDALGTIEIKSTEDLTRLDSLTLVHPWIDFLLDRRPAGSFTETIPEDDSKDQSPSMSALPSFPGPSDTRTNKQGRASHLVARLAQSVSAQLLIAQPRYSALHSSPPPASLTDKQTQAVQFAARLKQPFGALLLAPRDRDAAEYRRVASQSLITVQVREDTSLDALMAKAQVLSVL